jgi:hypothetical protein
MCRSLQFLFILGLYLFSPVTLKLPHKPGKLYQALRVRVFATLGNHFGPGVV